MNKTKLGVAEIHINIRKLMKGLKRGLRCHELRNLYSTSMVVITLRAALAQD